MPHSEHTNPGEVSTDTPCFSLRLFGAIEVRVNGNPMRSLRSRKGLWLLALLAVRGRPTSRLWIAENLWPDSDTQDALRNLRNSLHDLRSALDTDAWRVQSPDSATLDLNLTDADCDVHTFDRLIKQGNRAALYEAIELHSSPLLVEHEEIWSTI